MHLYPNMCNRMQVPDFQLLICPSCLKPGVIIGVGNHFHDYFIFFTDDRWSSNLSHGHSRNIFQCPNNCGRVYKYKSGMLSHLKLQCGQEPKFSCQFCDKKFYYRSNLKKHVFVTCKQKNLEELVDFWIATDQCFTFRLASESWGTISLYWVSLWYEIWK